MEPENCSNMAEATILSVVEKLDILLAEKQGLIRSSETQLKWLKYDFKLMLAFLSDSARSCNKLEDLMSQVTKIAHDTEDIIEIFVKSGGVEGRVAPYPNQEDRLNIFRKEVLFIRNRLENTTNVSHEVKSIRNRVQEIYNCKHQIGVEGAESSTRSENVGGQHKLADWEVGYEDAVGLEEQVALLLSQAILHDVRGLYTSCIVGMGGVGKSTLAGKLYKRAVAAGMFDCCAWVRVSCEFSQEEVLMALLQQVLSLTKHKLNMLLKNMEHVNKQSLEHMLRQHLQDKRYFIVLDDDVGPLLNYLEPLLRAFPSCEDKASRLLFTSRTRISVKHAQYIHVMRIMSPDQSWKLFLKTVFSGYSTGEHKCPQHLEKIGRSIVKKCNGLPLAIKEVGSHLAKKKPSKSEWKEYLSSMKLSVTLEVLELSCHKLPLELKLCFYSVAFFQEGTTIRAEKLVQLWTTGGMISREENYETSDDIARRYLDRLIIEYMVEIKDMTKDYRVKNLRINDNLHRLSVKKAEEEMSFEILRKERIYRPSSRPCHRAIYCSRENFHDSTNKDEHIISLFFRGGGNFNPSPSYWKGFKKLFILDLEGFGLKFFPKRISTLTRLRYLGLRNNCIQELSWSLRHLKKLEVLDITQNFTVKVPNIIWEMDSLRHLYMSDITCQQPLKIDALENLQTLTYISIDNWTYKLQGLQMMTRLRKLGIEELDENSNVSKLFTSILARLKNLDCLILRGFHYRSMPSLDRLHILHHLTQLKLDGLITRFPSANNFPPNISYLTLFNTSLIEDPMPVLEKLSKVFYLRLRNAYIGQQMVISRDGFPELQVMCIEELHHLRNVKLQEGALLLLERLEINNCPYLETLPEEILTTNLSELKIVTTKKIARKIRESGLISNLRHVDIHP